MDLREYYVAIASTITEADLRLTAVVMSAHVGKANAITKAELTQTLFGKTTDSTERKAREVIAELRSRARQLTDRAFSLFSVSLPSPTTINRLQGGLF